MLRKILLLGVLALGGCVSGPSSAGPAPLRTISYETGRCFGACPVYAVTVSSDGTGRFEGKQFTTVSGEQAFAVTPQQFARFEAALAPYRPANGEADYSQPPLCKRMATDLPSVDIRWDGPSPAHLYYYYGCDMEKNATMADALRHAVDALPIAALIKAR